MELYKRPISKKLISIRVIGLLLSSACIYSFVHDYSNLGYFLAVCITTLQFVVIKDFRISSDAVLVKKYFLLGWLPLNWTFTKNNVEYTFNGSDFGSYAEQQVFADDDYDGLGCLYSILSLALPCKITQVAINIHDKEKKDGGFKSVNIFLTKEEYNRLFEFTNGK